MMRNILLNEHKEEEEGEDGERGRGGGGGMHVVIIGGKKAH